MYDNKYQSVNLRADHYDLFWKNMHIVKTKQQKYGLKKKCNVDQKI